MSLNAKLLIKVFSPRMFAKIVSSLDKSAAIVVSACWLAALFMLVLAVFAVHGAVSSRREAAEAIALEPVVPVAASMPISAHDLQDISDRLKHQFPDINISVGQNQMLAVKSDDSTKFHQWITALSYFDTTAPQYRWVLHEFCVGVCSNGHDLMKAEVTGQKMVFSLPPH